MELAGHALPESRYFRLEQLADGVYAAIVVPGTGAWGNAGIVELGDSTLVFDAFFTPQAARDLRAAAERLTDRPVACVVNSHHHWDHVNGNQVFAGADIIATSRTRELIATRGAALIEQAKAHPEYPQTLAERLEHEQDVDKRKELALYLADVREFASAPYEKWAAPSQFAENPRFLHERMSKSDQ